MTPTRPAPNRPDDGGSFRLARVSGIPIHLHWTFLALLIWFAVSSLANTPQNGRDGAMPAYLSLVFVIALFACVVLHELGHALTAMRYGIRTRDIVLYPIGGIATLETMPRPRQELWIALAGPLVNLIIAGALYAGLRVANQPMTPFRLGATGASLAANLMTANVFLGVFNMLPAFPMDGGRVLRALIARRTDEATATALAAQVGQWLAIAMGIYGLLRGPGSLVFIAVFVYLGARQEASAYQTKALVIGHRVREAMLREFHTLTVGTTLREAADLLLAGNQHDFPVVHGDEVTGVLPRAALMRGMANEGADAYVAGVMQREFLRVRPDDDLETVLTEAMSLQLGPILVMEGEKLVGMVTQENLLEFLMLARIRQAAEAQTPASRRG